jgi:tetratricopeptide (TPR) repeat protein
MTELRRSLLVRVQARLARFGADHDPATVLDPEAVAEVTALFEAVADPAADIEVALAAGWLHWSRYLVLDVGEDQRDLVAARVWFAPVYEAIPDALPAEVRGYFDENRSAAALLEEAVHGDDRAALDRAIDLLRQTAAAASDFHSDPVMYLSDIESAHGTAVLADLARLLEIRYRQEGRSGDLDEAIEVGRRVVAVAPADATALGVLGTCLRLRFEARFEESDLTEAVDALRKASDALRTSSAGHPQVLHELAGAVHLRYRLRRGQADLDESVSLARQALATAPADDAERPSYLLTLGGMLHSAYRYSWRETDLDEAVTLCREASELLLPGDPRTGGAYANLALALRGLFERHGRPSDLDDALDAARRAVGALVVGNEQARARGLLGDLLHQRYETTGRTADLVEAIEVKRAAVAAFAPGHLDRGLALHNLGWSLSRRAGYARRPEEQDAVLGEAERAAQAAVDAGSASAGDRAMFLSQLGSIRSRRSRLNRDLDALAGAIETCRRAVADTPAGDERLRTHLQNLAVCLNDRYQLTGAPLHIRRSLGVDADPAEAPDTETAEPPADLPADLAERAATMRMYLNQIQRVFGVADDQIDVASLTPDADADNDEAITLMRRVVALTPAGHPDYGVAVSNLGNLLARGGRSDDESQRAEAAACYRAAADAESSPATIRLTAAWRWGTIHALYGDREGALAAFTRAVDLLGLLAWHGLDRDTRSAHLTDWAGLASDAAAAALDAGRPERAVELLERGRTVLWNQVLHLRSDVDVLAAAAPGLASRLSEIRRVLDAPPEHSVGSETATASTDLRLRLAREWDDLIRQARRLPGFEHFARPTPFGELRDAAADGPVVVVNTSRRRCDALILVPPGPGTAESAGRDGVVVVGLPDLDRQDPEAMARDLHTALRQAAAPGSTPADEEHARQVLLAALDRLWEAVAQPVLAALRDRQLLPSGDAPGQPERRARVWWCLTGAMAMLPVHAAQRRPGDGDWMPTDAAPTDSALTHAVSSYTPTLAALLRSRAAPQAPDSPVRLLAVGTPETPDGTSPLPAAADELQAVGAKFAPPPQSRLLVGPTATPAAVLEGLGVYPWVHLACHGVLRPTDPARSALRLWGGELTVLDIAARTLDHAELAYLSACHTANPGAAPDEALHLAAAMQLAGYRHVVATLWSVGDDDAAAVADGFYRHVADTGRPDPARAANALHGAVTTMRTRHRADPVTWAGYVHYGP